MHPDTDTPPRDVSRPGTEWVSFVDEAGETWLFDLSFFGSTWNCIYGSGCAGIEEHTDVAGHRGCCSYGAHFSDEEDLVRVMRIAQALPASLWQNHSLRPDASEGPADDLSALTDALTAIDDDGDRATRVVDGACVFLNRPGFHSGPGCALHTAATQTGIDPHEWKPEVCWQLPMRVEHHVDDHDHVTHIVRQWTRRDWGDAGQDLGWWCAEADEAYAGAALVADSLRAELVALAGAQVADALSRHVRGSGTLVRLPAPRTR